MVKKKGKQKKIKQQLNTEEVTPNYFIFYLFGIHCEDFTAPTPQIIKAESGLSGIYIYLSIYIFT